MRFSALLQSAAKLLPKPRWLQAGATNVTSLTALDKDATDPNVSQNTKSDRSPNTSISEPCPICHDPVGVPNPENITESWTQLHCGHRFGTVCIQTWLQETIDRDQAATPACPICRDSAKHPGCGHLVCPGDFDQQVLRFLLERQRAQQRVQRNRLRRREGHPHRPPPPPKRQADTIGQCKTCADNAVAEAREQRLTQLIAEHRAQQAQNDQAVPPPQDGRSSGSRARGVKSLFTGHVRMRSSEGESSTSPTPLSEGEQLRGRVQSARCGHRSDGGELRRVQRTPTPVRNAEAQQRRGSI